MREVPVNSRDRYLQGLDSEDVVTRINIDILTKEEKPAFVLFIQQMLSTKVVLDTNATNYLVTTEKTTYDDAITSLTTYLAALPEIPVKWDNITNSTNIVRSVLNTKINLVTSTKQALELAINTKSGITGYLTNPTVALQADSGGIVASLSSASGTFKVYKSGTEVTGTAVTYSIFSQTNCTMSINSSTGVYTLNTLTDKSGRVTLRALYKDIVIEANFTVVVAKDGTSAPLLYLSSTAQTFTYDSVGALAPTSQTITLTANLQNIVGTATFYCTLYNISGSSLGGVTLGGFLNARTLTSTQFGVAAYATITATLGLLTDTMTIVKLSDGALSVVSLLTNESHTVPADSVGNVTSYVGASTTMKVYKGLVDDSANWSFSATSPAITFTQSTNTFTVGSIDVSINSSYIEITATRSGYPTQVKRFSLSKSLAGTSAPLLFLSSTAQTFTFDSVGALSPTSQTISLTANLQNIIGTAVFTCTLYNVSGSSLGGITLGGSTNTRTLTSAQFGSAAYATIVATLNTLTDTMTVVKLSDGALSVVSVLTNESHTLPADSLGTVTSYAGASTTMKVYKGLVDDSANWAFSGSIPNSTDITFTPVGTSSTNTFAVSLLNASISSSYIDIKATRAGYPDQVKRFSLSKSLAGSSAPLLYLSSTAQAITFDSVGVLAPASQTITLTANLQNIVGTAAFTCTLYSVTGTNIGSVTLGGSTNSRTLTSAQFGVAAYATIVATLSTLTDTMTVIKLSDGALSVASVLSNESHTLQADSAGNVANYTGASTAMKVYKGLVDDSANWSFTGYSPDSASAPSNITYSIVGNVVTLSVLAASVNSTYIDITATRTGYPTQVKRFSISKSLSGSSAPLLSLASTSQAITFDSVGALAPASQTITFTATLQNIVGTATFACSLYNVSGTNISNVTLGGSTNIRTLTSAQFGVAAYATIVASLGALTDTTTIIKLSDGALSVASVLSNESHTLQADSAGNVASYVGASTSMKVYKGLVDDSANWIFSASTTTDALSITYSLSANVLTLSYLAPGVNSTYIDITATRTGYPTQVKRFSVSKSLAGTSAPLLFLASTSQAITFNSVGALAPANQTITLTANLQNITGTAAFACTLYSVTGTNIGSVTLGGSTNIRTLTSAQFGAAAYATIVATLSTLTDTMTIIKLSDGALSVASVLSNESHTLPANSSGIVTSYVGASTTMKVYTGLVDDSANWSFTGYSPDSAASNITYSIVGNVVTLSVLAASVNSTYIDITATKSGFATQVKRFSISKSMAGSNGSNGTNGTNGAVGPRGTVTISAAASTGSWSDSEATAAIAAAGYGTPVNRDIVTLYNSGFTQTRYYNGGSWVIMTQYIDGNLLVSGTVSAASLSADAIIGKTYKTATSGNRITINESNNMQIIAFDSSGNLSCIIGGINGGVFGDGITSKPGVYGQVSGTFAALRGNSSSSGQGLLASSNTGVGVESISNYSHGGIFKGLSTGAYTSGKVALGDGSGRAFYAESGTYAPFTGSHDAVILPSNTIEMGDIVVDKECLAKNGISDTIFLVEVSTYTNQKASIGVLNTKTRLSYIDTPVAFLNPAYLETYNSLKYTHDYISVNSIGEGQINVCGQNGNIEAGDFIVCSNMPGKGMKQLDDIYHNYTVAKARESQVFSNPTETKMIACIYLCG